MYKITTVMALPGVGKTTYCRERAAKGLGQGEARWAPEPTDDISELRSVLSPTAVQQVIRQRFIARDSGPNPAQWRDSDVFTSSIIFGGLESLSENPELWIPQVSDTLIWLQTSPEEQARRIKLRGRDIWSSELEFCSSRYQDLACKAFTLHPAKHKLILPS